jgi:hypothetical protein
VLPFLKKEGWPQNAELRVRRQILTPEGRYSGQRFFSGIET